MAEMGSRTVEGITVADIAKKLGVRPNTVRRAVRRLRGRTNNVGKGGLYTWPSFENAEVQAIQRAIHGGSEGPVDVQQLTVRLPKDLHFAIRTIAVATDSSINDLVIRALADYIADSGRREEVRAYIHEAQEQFRVTLDKLKDL